MQKAESKSAIKMRHWIMANPRYTCSIETKDTRGKDNFLFSVLTEEELNYALARQEGNKGVVNRASGAEALPH